MVIVLVVIVISVVMFSFVRLGPTCCCDSRMLTGKPLAEDNACQATVAGVVADSLLLTGTASTIHSAGARHRAAVEALKAVVIPCFPTSIYERNLRQNY